MFLKIARTKEVLALVPFSYATLKFFGKVLCICDLYLCRFVPGVFAISYVPYCANSTKQTIFESSPSDLILIGFGNTSHPCLSTRHAQIFIVQYFQTAKQKSIESRPMFKGNEDPG